MNKSLYILGLFLLFIPVATALNISFPLNNSDIYRDTNINYSNSSASSYYNISLYSSSFVFNRTIASIDILGNEAITKSVNAHGYSILFKNQTIDGTQVYNITLSSINSYGSTCSWSTTYYYVNGSSASNTSSYVSSGSPVMANPNPTYAVNLITIMLDRSDITGDCTATINSYNSTLRSLNYLWSDIYLENLSIGNYYINVSGYNSLGSLLESNITYVNLTFNSLLTITAINYTGGSVTSFNATITNLNTSTSYNYGTTSGTIEADMIQGNSYSVLMYSSQLANSTYNITMQNFTQSLQYSAFPFNSINITAYLESTLALTNINASLLFTGSSYSYSYSLNGNSQIYSFFGDDTYSVQVIASGYATRTYVVSVSNGSAQSLNIYMLPSNSSSSIGIYTRTLEDDIISGATIYIQHLINSSYTGLTQGITDGTGYIVFQLEEGKTYRMIISADNFNIFTRDIVPYASNSPYTFKLSPSSTFNYVTLTDYAKYWYSPTDSNLNGTNQTFTFTTYSVNGSIIYTYINCDGSIQNVSGSPTGSSVSVNLNYSANDIIDCTFAMSISGYGYYSFNQSYYAFDEVGTSIKNSANYIRNNTDNLWLTLLAYVITLLIVVGIKQNYPDTRITGVILCVGMIFFTSLGWINAVAGGVSATIGLLLLYVGSRS